MSTLIKMACCFPRMRGGDPLKVLMRDQGLTFSPHARG